MDFECSTKGNLAEAARQDDGTPKSKSTQPRSTSRWDTLYIRHNILRGEMLTSRPLLHRWQGRGDRLEHPQDCHHRPTAKRSAPFFTISALNSSPLMLPKPHLMVISCETCDTIAINVPKFLEFQNYVNVGAGNQTIPATTLFVEYEDPYGGQF